MIIAEGRRRILSYIRTQSFIADQKGGDPSLSRAEAKFYLNYVFDCEKAIHTIPNTANKISLVSADYLETVANASDLATFIMDKDWIKLVLISNRGEPSEWLFYLTPMDSK